MKRWLCILFALALLFAISACAAGGSAAPVPTGVEQAPIEAGHAPVEENIPAPDGAAMYLKVARVFESSFLGMGMGDRATAQELYFVSTANVPYTEDKPLVPGTLVTVFYDGLVLETYPATIAAPAHIAWSGDLNDTVGLYMRVLKELYQQDAALNDGITMLGFDLGGAENLSEAEKAALEYLMGCEYGLETVSGTYDELCQQGYIDREKLYFPEGVLLSISNIEEQSDTRFTFSASKWRSGLGAIGMDGCTAEYVDGEWKYTPGGMWIS